MFINNILITSLLKDKKGDFDFKKISLLILGLFVLISFVWLVIAAVPISSCEEIENCEDIVIENCSNETIKTCDKNCSIEVIENCEDILTDNCLEYEIINESETDNCLEYEFIQNCTTQEQEVCVDINCTEEINEICEDVVEQNCTTETVCSEEDTEEEITVNIYEDDPENIKSEIKVKILKKNEIEIDPSLESIEKIEFKDVEIINDSISIGLVDLDEEEFVQSYAIDPTELNFTKAVVTVIAEGTELYKCKDWNFTIQECYGEWELFKTGLVPGEEYSFILTPDDPGFGESISVINVQSYPVINGEWEVRFNTIGTADLTIKAVDGTTWSDSNEDNDLKFLEIRCGDDVLDYEFIDDSVFIQDYSCAETGYEISKVLTYGEHDLEFDFGGQKAYAHNLVQNITSVVLNSSSATNLSSENLTANPIPFNSSQKYIYDWKLEGDSIMTVNFPMDGGTKEYINGITVTVEGNTAYNSSGGYDNKGSYYFDGSGDRMLLPNNYMSTKSFTYLTWIKFETTSDDKTIFGHYGGGNNEILFWIDKGIGDKLYLELNDVNNISTGSTTLTAGNWYHVGFSRDFATGEVKVYLNGAVDGTGTYSTELGFGNCQLRIGADIDSSCGGGYGEYFKGYIDEVMIFNKSLSTEQVAAIYSNQTSKVVSQETMQGDIWQSCVTPNDNTADGTEVCSNTLAVENISVVLNSTDVSTNYSTDNLTAYPVGLLSGDKAFYNWKVDGSSILALNMPFDGGLLAEGGTKVKDYSGNYNGTVVNAVYNSTGGYDGKGAYYFDGSGDYISTTLVDANVHSVSFWMNPNATDDADFIMGQRYDASEESGNWQLDFTASDELRFLYYTASNTYSSITSSTTFSTGLWYHVIVTTDGSNTWMYVNGNLVANGTGWNTYFGGGDNDNDLMIGRSGANAAWYYFKGYLDEVKLFNRSLTVEQILALYNNNTDIIVSGETFVGEVWQTCVTPNDNVRDGTQICSNNITVAGAQIESVVLNSSSGNNYTSDNLTANPINMLPTEARAIYDWKKNGDSVKIFEMTFDGGKLCEGGTTVCDYAGGYNGTPEIGGAIGYISTIGYNGTGAYNFNEDNFININPDINLIDSFSISAWTQRGSITGTVVDIFSTSEANVDYRVFHMGFDNNHKAFCSLGTYSAIGTTAVTDGDWHFVTCTYNWASNEMKVYLDGIEENSYIFAQDPDLDAVSETVIGSYSPTIAYNYSGKIDEVVVWDMELSSEQISAMYDNGDYRTDLIVAEQTAYGDVWSVCATPNNNLMHGDEVCSNNLTIEGIDVSLSSTSGNNLTTDSLTVSVAGLFGDDKAFYDWKLDGASLLDWNVPMDGGALSGTNVTNYGSLNENLTQLGNVLPTYLPTGGFDGKGAFDFTWNATEPSRMQTNQHVDVTDKTYSLEAWIKQESYLVNNQTTIIAWGGSNAQATDGVISLRTNNASGGNYLEYGEDSTGWVSINTSGGTQIYTGQWYHVVATHDVNDYVRLYINGVEVKNGTVNSYTNSSATAITGIGFAFVGGAVQQGWDGIIDEVKIWDITLSPEQVSANYNNQTNKIVPQETIYEDVWQVCATPNDNVRDGARVCSNNLTVQSVSMVLNSSSGTNLTNENLTSYDSNLFGDDKLFYDWKLDGSSIAVLNMPFDGGALCGVGTNLTCDYAGGNNGTLGNGTSGTEPIYNSTGGFDGKGAYEFDGVNDYIESTVTQNKNTISLWYKNSTASEWTYIVNSSGTTYVNGVAGTPGQYPIYINSNAVQVGKTGGASFFNGTIDEVQIYQRALSAEQISALYNNQTNKIVSQETTYGDVWQACVTPNDNVRDDGLVCTNNLTVDNIDVALTSTDVSTNFSSENLSALVSGLIGSDRAIYDWHIDGSSIAVLNMPFDGGTICGIGNNLTCDYSGYGNNGTVNGSIYNSTGGYDGKGAYEFDGVNDSIESTVTQNKNTISLWYKNSTASEWTYIVNSSGTTYVNGAAGTPGQYPIYINSNAVQVGKTSGASFFNGTIDEVLIYDRALSAEQISAMYNNGTYRTNIIVSNETLTDEDWQACVTASDDVRNGKQVCSGILTVMADMTISTNVTPYVVTNGSSVTLNMSVLTTQLPINATWANLTYPNTTVITINSFPYVFNNTNATGIYNVTFYANDSAGDRVSNDDYFESFVPVTFNFTIIDFNTIGVDSSWELYYRDEVIRSNGSSTGNHSAEIPDALSDLKIKSYTNRLQITLEDINVTLENGKNFGMDKLPTPETGYLVTYGVNNSYAFTNAVVRIYYDDLSGSYSTEGNLKLYKCDNYDFVGRSCSGSWEDITSSATQDTGSDYFEYNATSFSGFSIKEVTPPSAPSGEVPSEEGGGGVKIENVTIIPSQLFDISLSLDDTTIQSSDELSAVVTFESFGTEPTPVALTFIIRDGSGSEVYRVEDTITVTTEELMRKSFKGLNLAEGKYTFVLQTLYNVDVYDEFKQEFEIGKERKGITGEAIDWIGGEGKWWLIGIIGGILIILLVWWLTRKFKKLKKRHVKKYKPSPKTFIKPAVKKIPGD